MDQKLGIIVIRAKAFAPDLLTALTGSPLDIGIGIPESLPRNFSRREDGQGYDVLLNFEGHLSPDAADGEEYVLDGTTSEEPIETHVDYLALLETYGGNDSEGRPKWPKTLGEDGDRNPMHGIEQYLVAGEVWTKRWVSSSLPGSIVRSLGAIEQPPGNPPELEGQRNWLKIRARANFRGNVWQIEESWLLSGPGGWVTEVYRYR